MGWLFMTKDGMGGHASAKAYLDAQFTYEHKAADGTTPALRVLASSCLHNRVWYAAAEPSTDGSPGPVFALVCLVRWNPRDREGYIFGYKDMDETMGPCEAECPQRILDLLGPTDNEHATDWRRRCLDNLQRRARPVEHGMRISICKIKLILLPLLILLLLLLLPVLDLVLDKIMECCDGTDQTAQVNSHKLVVGLDAHGICQLAST